MNTEREEREHLPDVLDRASARSEEMIEVALADVRRAQASMPPPTGHCLWCEAEIEDNPKARFCDGECGAAWQNYTDKRRRQGFPAGL